MPLFTLSPAEQAIQDKVAKTYSAFPFPKRTARGIFQRNQEFFTKLERVGVTPADIRGKRVLDAGCGTGELACLWASLGAEVTAIDIVKPSLEIAQRTARAAGVDITFHQGSLLEYPLPEQAFDIVSSHMVLHHTADPARSFANIARCVKPGGLIFICVFGLWGRLILCRHPLWKIWLVHRLAGPDSTRRVRLAERWCYHPGEEAAHGLEQEQYLYDLYGVAQVKHHTYGEMLRWFRDSGIAYVSSWPPMEFRREYDTIMDGSHAARSPLGRLGRWGLQQPPVQAMARAQWANRPGRMSRALTQALAFVKSDSYMFNVLGRRPQ